MTKQNVFGAVKYALLIATMFVVAVMFSACDLFGGGDSAAKDAFDKAVKTTAEYTGSYTVRMTSKSNAMTGEDTDVITYNAETSEFAYIISSGSVADEMYVKKNGDTYKKYAYTKIGTTIDKSVEELPASEVVGKYSIAGGMSGVQVKEPTSEEVNEMFAQVFGVTFETEATFNKSVKKDGKLNVATYEVSNEKGEGAAKIRCVATAIYKADTKLTSTELKYERYDGTAAEPTMLYTATQSITYTYDSTIMPTDFSKFDNATTGGGDEPSGDDETGDQNAEQQNALFAELRQVINNTLANDYTITAYQGNTPMITETYDAKTQKAVFSYLVDINQGAPEVGSIAQKIQIDVKNKTFYEKYNNVFEKTTYTNESEFQEAMLEALLTSAIMRVFWNFSAIDEVVEFMAAGESAQMKIQKNSSSFVVTMTSMEDANTQSNNNITFTLENGKIKSITTTSQTTTSSSTSEMTVTYKINATSSIDDLWEDVSNAIEATSGADNE